MQTHQTGYRHILASCAFGLVLSFAGNSYAADEYSIEVDLNSGGSKGSVYSTASTENSYDVDIESHIQNSATGVSRRFNSSVILQTGSFNSAQQSTIGSFHSTLQVQVGNQNAASTAVIGGQNNTVATYQFGDKNTSALGVYGSSNTRATHLQVGSGHTRSILVLGGNGVNVLVIQR